MYLYIHFLVDKDHEYIVPVKGVKVPDDMRLWEKSDAYFVSLNHASMSFL